MTHCLVSLAYAGERIRPLPPIGMCPKKWNELVRLGAQGHSSLHHEFHNPAPNCEAPGRSTRKACAQITAGMITAGMHDEGFANTAWDFIDTATELAVCVHPQAPISFWGIQVSALSTVLSSFTKTEYLPLFCTSHFQVPAQERDGPFHLDAFLEERSAHNGHFFTIRCPIPEILNRALVPKVFEYILRTSCTPEVLAAFVPKAPSADATEADAVRAAAAIARSDNRLRSTSNFEATEDEMAAEMSQGDFIAEHCTTRLLLSYLSGLRVMIQVYDKGALHATVSTTLSAMNDEDVSQRDTHMDLTSTVVNSCTSMEAMVRTLCACTVTCCTKCCTQCCTHALLMLYSCSTHALLTLVLLFPLFLPCTAHLT
jgi:hypothetical protein